VAEHHRFTDGCYERLVAPAIFVIDVLADHLPVRDVEYFISKETVGVFKPVENEPGVDWLERVLRGLLLHDILMCEALVI
jgi:hypothetical protein